MFTMNLIGDVANTLLGTEPRAVIGIPIVLTLLYYLTRPGVRKYFDRQSASTK
jgi:hypothetical protein